MKKVLLAVSVLVAGSMMACSTDHRTVSESDHARGKYESVVVNFAPGSSRIPSSEISQLQTVASELQANDHLDGITAAVWSDREFPTDRNVQLPQAQVDLAKARIDAIQAALRPYKSVTAHNMAEHAPWYARAVNSDGAELESLFAKRDPQAMDRNDFSLIKSFGGPMKGVVVFERK